MTSGEFEIIFKKLYLPLGMYAMRILGDPEVAEDMTQEAFMKTWLYLERGGAIADIQSFLYRSLRNICISYLRSRPELLGAEAIPEIDEEEIDTSFRDAAI